MKTCIFPELGLKTSDTKQVEYRVRSCIASYWPELDNYCRVLSRTGKCAPFSL